MTLCTPYWLLYKTCIDTFFYFAVMDEVLLRVHSRDLHEHLVQEVGECLETGLYTDLIIRCKGGHAIHAHKLVLSAASPYLIWVSSDYMSRFAFYPG